jgi:hypothetical protein
MDDDAAGDGVGVHLPDLLLQIKPFCQDSGLFGIMANGWNSDPQSTFNGMTDNNGWRLVHD